MSSIQQQQQQQQRAARRVSPYAAGECGMALPVHVPAIFASCDVGHYPSTAEPELTMGSCWGAGAEAGPSPDFLSGSDPFAVTGHRIVLVARFTQPLIPARRSTPQPPSPASDGDGTSDQGSGSRGPEASGRLLDSLGYWEGHFHGRVAAIDYATMTCRVHCRNDTPSVARRFAEVKGLWHVQLRYRRNMWRLDTMVLAPRAPKPATATPSATATPAGAATAAAGVWCTPRLPGIRRPRAKRSRGHSPSPTPSPGPGPVPAELAAAGADANDAAHPRKRGRRESPALAGPSLLEVDTEELVATLQSTGQHQDAIEACTRTLETTECLETSCRLYLARAKSLFGLGQYQLALEDAELTKSFWTLPVASDGSGSGAAPSGSPLRPLMSGMAQVSLLRARAFEKLGVMAASYSEYRAAQELGSGSRLRTAALQGLERVRERAGEYMLYTLRVSLVGSETFGADSLVWRRIRVHSETTLAELHTVIQVAMGWGNQHDHWFKADNLSFGRPSQRVVDDRCVTLREFLADSPQVLYLYDGADGWEHSIQVESRSTCRRRSAPHGCTLSHQGLPAWRCLAGANACPPESIGGVHGYLDFLGFLRGQSDHDTFFSLRDALEWVAEQVEGTTNAGLARLQDGLDDVELQWQPAAFAAMAVDRSLGHVHAESVQARDLETMSL